MGKLENIKGHVRLTLEKLPCIKSDVNSLILGENNLILTEERSYQIEKGNLCKRYKYAKRCKDNVWNRWMQETEKKLNK